MMNWIDQLRKVVEGTVDNYDDRAVVPKTEIDGFAISTVDTPDHGLETAIIDTHGQAHPVERYKTKAKAKEGHEHWCHFIRCGGRHIVRIGGWDTVPDTEVTLK